MKSPSRRPCPKGPPAWLQTPETAPNAPSFQVIARSVRPTRASAIGAFLNSSTGPRSCHCMERLLHHVGVDSHRVLDAARVAAGKETDNGDRFLDAGPEHQPVPPPQVLAREPQPAQLIVLERIRPRDVGDELWPVLAQDRRHPVLERGQIG